MSRPDQRPMKRLPMLEVHRTSFETCVFCPKLCRSACPVSNAEPRETLTPWGKVSMGYFSARGDVPADTSFAAPAWACTGCMACRESCDHKNDVTTTLLATRAALARTGLSPDKAKRALARFRGHDAATTQAVRELSAHPRVRADARTALLIGCSYVRGAMPEARSAIAATSALEDAPVRLVDECCGLPLLHAGDAERFEEQAHKVAKSLRGVSKVVVADAGCAMALRVRYGEAGVQLSAPVTLVVEEAAKNLSALHTIAGADHGPVRYHDPCQLGRGLGLYDEPRAILTRALGRAPDEFDERREHAACSGAGGGLPQTMEATSRAITSARLDAHERKGGGRIVTACGSSLLKLRRRSHVPVSDLLTWLERSLATESQA